MTGMATVVAMVIEEDAYLRRKARSYAMPDPAYEGEDMLQDTYLALLSRPARGTPPPEFANPARARGYVARALSFRVRSQARHARVTGTRVVLLPIHATDDATEDRALDGVAVEEALADGFDPRLLLAIYQALGWSASEAAAFLGMSRRNATRRLYNYRHRAAVRHDARHDVGHNGVIDATPALSPPTD